VASAAATSGRAFELMTFGQPSSAVMTAMRPFGNSGDAAAYTTVGPPPGATSGALVAAGRTERGPSGWSNTPVGLPFTAHSSEFFSYFIPVLAAGYSDDLQTKLWMTSVPVTPEGPPEGQLGLYWQAGDEEPRYIAHIGSGLTLTYPGFAGISEEGGTVVFTTAEHLLPSDAGRTEGESAYVWDPQQGLRQVNLATDGSPLSECGSAVSEAAGMSATGQRVFFTQPVASGCVLKRVFLHYTASGITEEISASQCTRVDCNAPQDVTFAGATADGTTAFLVTSQQLTDEDHDEGRDLYRYDVGSGELTLLSGGSAEAAGEMVPSTVYPSDNGSRVYFRATGVMIPGETSTEEKLFYADATGMHLVAVASFPEQAQIQLSANGSMAIFVTASKVTEDDTDESQDVYLYDLNQDSVTRISQGASGGNGPFEANLNAIQFPELEPGDHRTAYAIDAAGDREFFATPEALLPEDVNEKPDIYEWHGGQLSLVTPGEEEAEVKFAGASRDGMTVAFSTTQTLVPDDQDGGEADLYAARIGGGFPPVEPPPPCTDATCPGPVRSPSSRPLPRTATAKGARKKKIRLLEIRSAKGKAIGPRTSVLVFAPVPGLVSATVWVPRGGGEVRAYQGKVGASKPGKVWVALRRARSAKKPAGSGIRNGRLEIRERGARPLSRRVRVSLGRTG
jgi:hypothetical protein